MTINLAKHYLSAADQTLRVIETVSLAPGSGAHVAALRTATIDLLADALRAAGVEGDATRTAEDVYDLAVEDGLALRAAVRILFKDTSVLANVRRRALPKIDRLTLVEDDAA